MRVTVLGSGSSSGVPGIGLGWGDCDPNEPKNKRTRSGLLIEIDDLTILFDTSPDCREQLLMADVTHIDAVLYTHAHADHCHGIDEMRWLCQSMNSSIPIYGQEDCLNELQERFAYCFTSLDETAHNYFYKPVLIPNSLPKPYQPFKIKNIEIIPFEQDHGFSKTLGFRIENFAYSTDVVHLDDTAFGILEGVDTWVLGCLRPTEHQTHIHTNLALEWFDKINVQNGYLTHMSVFMDYSTLCHDLPKHIRPAYDGLSFEV